MHKIKTTLQVVVITMLLTWNGIAQSGLPVGLYQGYDTYTGFQQNMKITYKEKIAILDAGRYEFRNGDTVKSGTYSYDAGSGVVKFLTGPYADPDITAKFGARGDGKPMLTITYTFPKLGSDDDFFVKI